MTRPETPDLAPATDVVVDPDHLDEPHPALTTDDDQRADDLDPNEGEGGAG